MDIEKEKSFNLKKSERKIYFKVIIVGLIGAVLGIIAYIYDWLG